MYLMTNYILIRWLSMNVCGVKFSYSMTHVYIVCGYFIWWNVSGKAF